MIYWGGSAAKQLMVSRIVGTHANSHDDLLVDQCWCPRVTGGSFIRTYPDSTRQLPALVWNGLMSRNLPRCQYLKY